jgi:hypothetical protein
MKWLDRTAQPRNLSGLGYSVKPFHGFEAFANPTLNTEEPAGVSS